MEPGLPGVLTAATESVCCTRGGTRTRGSVWQWRESSQETQTSEGFRENNHPKIESGYFKILVLTSFKIYVSLLIA